MLDELGLPRLLSGSEGGWQIINDGGKKFGIVNTFPCKHFYHIRYDLQNPYWVCAQYTWALQRHDSPYSKTCPHTKVMAHELAP